MNVVYGANKRNRKVHDEACTYAWKVDHIRDSISPNECPYCSDAEWWRDNMIASIEAQWHAHANGHMDSEACTMCRNFDSLICRMQRKPFAPVGIMQMVYGAEPYTPVGE